MNQISMTRAWKYFPSLTIAKQFWDVLNKGTKVQFLPLYDLYIYSINHHSLWDQPFVDKPWDIKIHAHTHIYIISWNINVHGLNPFFWSKPQFVAVILNFHRLVIVHLDGVKSQVSFFYPHGPDFILRYFMGKPQIFHQSHQIQMCVDYTILNHMLS